MADNVIIDKIKKKAEADVANILSEGTKKATQVSADIEAQTKQDLETLQKQHAAEVAEIKKRSELMSHLETRKNTLAAKRQLIDEAFDKAREALCNLDDAKWSILIAAIVAEASKSGSGKLRVPAKDRPKYENGFLTSLNRGLKSNGLPGDLTLDDTPADFDAGVMLVGDNCDINANFDILLDEVRDRYEKQVAAILFDGQDEALS